MGTPELARTSLEALIQASEVQVVGVVTQPDRPKGRELRLTPSPVKELAIARGLNVFQPEKARDHGFIELMRKLEPDLILVAAYGQILPRDLLEVPRFGCLNVHTSLLPKLRGAAPIQWAILTDEPQTGVTIMKMDTGLDTGDIVSQQTTPIFPEDDAETLHDRLALIGARLLIETLGPYTTGKLNPAPQPQEGVSYARKIAREDGYIDWQCPARAIWNQIRGLVPWPGAFTSLPGVAKSLIKIWKAELAQDSGREPGTVIRADKSGVVVTCGQSSIRIQSLQREGSRRLSAPEFLAGCPLKPGLRFGGKP